VAEVPYLAYNLPRPNAPFTLCSKAGFLKQSRQSDRGSVYPFETLMSIEIDCQKWLRQPLLPWKHWYFVTPP